MTGKFISHFLLQSKVLIAVFLLSAIFVLPAYSVTPTPLTGASPIEVDTPGFYEITGVTSGALININVNGVALTGTNTNLNIKLNTGITLTLRGVNITCTVGSPIVIGAGASKLILVGDNSVTSACLGQAGIFVHNNSSLVIEGPGKLTAVGYRGGAGIGGSLRETSGAITIQHATVVATGGSDSGGNGYGGGAGIGGGGGIDGSGFVNIGEDGNSHGIITIINSSVTATGGNGGTTGVAGSGGGAGIGAGGGGSALLSSGNGGNSGTIIITDATVTASGGAGGSDLVGGCGGAGIGGGGAGGAPAGAGNGGNCSTITINSASQVLVHGGAGGAGATEGGGGGAGVGGGGGGFFGGDGTSFASITIEGNTLATGCSAGLGGSGTVGRGAVCGDGGHYLVDMPNFINGINLNGPIDHTNRPNKTHPGYPTFSVVVQTPNVSLNVGASRRIPLTITGGTASFLYQWQVSTDGGSTWNDLSNGGIYANTTTDGLDLNVVQMSHSGYKFRCVVNDFTWKEVISDVATLTVNKRTPTLSLTAFPTSGATYNANVILTATLSGGYTTIGGTITFYINGIGNAVTVTLNGSYNYTLTAPAAGTYTFGASYSGDGNNDAANAADITNYTVARAITTTVLSPASPSVYGDPVTFTATVTSGAGVPVGSVEFREGATVLGTETLNASGVATFSTSTLSAATHPITAYYMGSANYNVSNNATPVNQVVGKKPLTITGTDITTSKEYDGNHVAAIITTGTLSGVVPGDNVTVSVSATYDNKDFGTGKTITGVYTLGGAGAGNYDAPANYVVITGEITRIQLTVSAPTITKTKGFDGTVNAAVLPGALSGVVGSEDVVVSATATYDNINVGTGKTITVVYTLTGNDIGNYIKPIDESANDGVITHANTATSLTAAPNPAILGQSVTFTASVNVVAPGVGTPAGSVNFYAGAALLGTGTLNGSGVATFSTSTLTDGNYSITASYSGNTTYNSSTSAATTMTVYGYRAVTVSSVGTGASGSGNYLPGATVSIDAGTPPAGKQFTGWTSSPAVTLANARSATTTFTMPTTPVTLTANFETLYAIKIGAMSNGRVTTNKSSALSGETVTVTATPSPGYVLTALWVSLTNLPGNDILVSGSGNTRSFTMPAANVTVMAAFHDPVYQAAWEAALKIIEAAKFTLTYQEAPDANTARYRLAVIINELLNNNAQFVSLYPQFYISPDDIVIFTFIPANSDGTNGHFEFRVTPPESRVSAYNNGTITAPPVANDPIIGIDVSAWIHNGFLYVSGLTPGETWSIYNLSGVMIYTGIAVEAKQATSLPERGIYIIIQGKTVVKVIM